MRRLILLLVALAVIASSCASPETHEIGCPQVAVGETVTITGAPVSTSSPWGFILDTVRWMVDNGVAITDWQLGGDLDNDALQAVVEGVEPGTATITVQYAQLNREGVGPVRTVTESCEIKVVEPPTFDIDGDWRMTRTTDGVCTLGPSDGDSEITIRQDSSGNLTVEGLNAGYEAWSGAIDGEVASFRGLRDEIAELGGGTTEGSFAIDVASSRSMTGTETYTWSDGTDSCSGTSELVFRRR